MKIQIPKEQLEKFKDEGWTVNQISKHLNLNVHTVRERLREYGIVLESQRRNKEKTVPFVNKQWLINNYVNSSKSLQQLADELGCTWSVLDNRRMLYGLHKKYKYPYNQKKLFNSKDPVVCYLAGLVSTDGWFDKNHNSIFVSMSGEDEFRVLDNIRNYFESTREIHKYKKGSNYLQFDGDGIKEFFRENFEITETKTFSLQFPKKFYSEDCARLFIRGCLDGDGSIGLTGKLSFLCASKLFILGMCEMLKQYTGVKINLNVEKRKSTANSYYVFYLGKESSKTVLNWVYHGYPEFRLERKYLRYIKNLL